MLKTKTVDKILKSFIEYLSNKDISKKSLKNYKSDVSHFSAWFMFKTRSWGVYAEKLTDSVPFITQSTALEYKTYLTQNNIPESTINRRLSTLRHLGDFLLASQILDFNFMHSVPNVSTKATQKDQSPLLTEFENHLNKEDVSENTIKNYKSDIRQFIEWLERTKAEAKSN